MASRVKMILSGPERTMIVAALAAYQEMELAAKVSKFPEFDPTDDGAEVAILSVDVPAIIQYIKSSDPLPKSEFLTTNHPQRGEKRLSPMEEKIQWLRERADQFERNGMLVTALSFRNEAAYLEYVDKQEPGDAA